MENKAFHIVQENIFSIVSVNKTVRGYIRDLLSIDDEHLSKYLALSLFKAESVGPSVSDFSNLALTTSPYYYSVLVMDNNSEEEARKVLGDMARTTRVEEAAKEIECKTLIELNNQVIKFRDECINGDEVDMGNHAIYNAYFNIPKYIKSIRHSVLVSFKENNKELRKSEEIYLEEMTNAIVLGVIIRFIKHYVGALISVEAEENELLQNDSKSEETCNGCCGGCQKDTDEPTKEVEDSDGILTKVIFFALGLVIGMAISFFMDSLM